MPHVKFFVSISRMAIAKVAKRAATLRRHEAQNIELSKNMGTFYSNCANKSTVNNPNSSVWGHDALRNTAMSVQQSQALRKSNAAGMINNNASIFNSLNVKGNEFNFGTGNSNNTSSNNNSLFYPYNKESDGNIMNDDEYGEFDDDEDDEDEANRNPYSLQPM